MADNNQNLKWVFDADVSPIMRAMDQVGNKIHEVMNRALGTDLPTSSPGSQAPSGRPSGGGAPVMAGRSVAPTSVGGAVQGGIASASGPTGSRGRMGGGGGSSARSVAPQAIMGQFTYAQLQEAWAGGLTGNPGLYSFGRTDPSSVAARMGTQMYSSPIGPSSFDPNKSIAGTMTADQMGQLEKTMMMYGLSGPPGMMPGASFGQRMSSAMHSGMDWWLNYQGSLGKMNYLHKMAIGFSAQNAADVASQGMGVAANEVAMGRPDVGGRYSFAGRTLGMILGGAAGFALGGPLLSPFMAGAGATVGEAAANWMAAGAVRDIKTTTTLLGPGGIRAGMGEFYDQSDYKTNPSTLARFFGASETPGKAPPSIRLARALKDWVRSVATSQETTLPGLGDYQANDQEIAATFSTVQESMVRGGVDPNRLTGGKEFLPGSPVSGPRFSPTSDSRNMIEIMKQVAANMGSRPKITQEELAKMVTKNIVDRYGAAAPEIGAQVAPVFASNADTGGNIVDIISKHGALPSARYLESLTPIGKTPAYSMADLSEFSTNMRMGERKMRFAQTHARGVGGMLETMLEGQLSTIESSFGKVGEGSLEYAEIRQQKRAAMFRRMDEERIEAFDIPMTRLQGRIDRSRLLPYSPGNAFGMELMGIGMKQTRLQKMRSQYKTLMDSGDLSEEQQLGMVTEMEGLETGIAGSIAGIAEGTENRIGAMSANRPRWAGRFNSMQLAAMRLRGPSRAFGAMNGAGIQTQDDFVRMFGIPAGGLGPGTTTGAMNNAAVGILQRIEEHLRKMADGKGLPERRNPSGSGGRVN